MADRWRVLGLLALAACTAPTDSDLQNPTLAVGSPEARAYIVTLARGVDAQSIAHAHGLTPRFVYRSALTGFAAEIPDQAIEGLRRNPLVQSIELDGIATIQTDQVNPPSWGLDRIDQRLLPLNQLYAYETQGSGVTAYIIDTGIHTHSEFAGRLTSGYDFIDNDADADDCHGHGTHVAGTVAGTTVGVAKQASLVAVRVLGCNGSGTWSQVIAGVDWVVANARRPAVANMSLGGGRLDAVNLAVDNAVVAGIVFAVAAGNNGSNACNLSPAGAGNALTTGATDITDTRATFSNFGTCLDVFAPGVNIRSSVQNGGYENWNGTSMATPHVAGVAALELAAYPAASAFEVNAAIKGYATPDRVVNAGTGSPNRLLFSLITTFSLPAPEPPTPPLPPLPPPPPPSPSVVVHIGDLDGSAMTKPRGHGPWKVSVSVLVHDGNHAPVAGVQSTGKFDGALHACSTGPDGRCTMTAAVSAKKASVTFEAGGIYSKDERVIFYDYNLYHDPDGDSDGRRLVVPRI